MVCGLMPTRASAGMERVARRKYFSRMYRAPWSAQSTAPPILQEGLLVIEFATLGGQELANDPC
jgi:hypothetical protein